MDVTCERCGTEYEFDETLVSDRGTTVKCTHCGHLFKVFRPGAADGPKTWTIRTRAGRTENLASLRDLQRLITQGELTRDDEISRSGESWKKLGDIAELITFFSAAEAGDEPPARPDGTQPFTTGATATPFSRSPSARPGSVPQAPTRGSGSGPLEPPPNAPPPKLPFPPSPSVPVGKPKSSSEGIESDKTMPAQSTSPEVFRPTDPKMQQAIGRKAPPKGKRTLYGVGGQAGAAGATVPDNQAAARAKASTGFDDQPTEVEERPPGSRTADRSVGRLEGLGRPADPAATRDDAVPPTRSMPKLEVPDPEPEPRKKVPTRQGYSDPGEAAVPSEKTSGARPAALPASQDQQRRGMYVDEDAEIAARRADAKVTGERKSRTGLWIALVVIVGIGVGAGLAWDRIAPILGLADPPDRVAEFVEHGEASMAQAHHDAYEDAIRELTRATAIEERDLRVLSGLSRAHGALAQELAFKTADLVIRANADPALSGEAAALRREREENAAEARRFGEDAVRIDPNHVTSVLALADALRLTGDERGARSHLDRARTLEPEASAEQLYVTALFELESPEASPAGAVDAARRAATAGPSNIRSRILLARALLAASDVAGARAEVDAILAAVVGHPHASYLAQAMDRGLAPAAPIVESLDGGVSDATVDAAADTAPAPSDPVAAQNAVPSAGGAPPRGRDYGYYVERGDELLERGDVGRARAMFEAGLEVRPGGAEAQTGLGYAMLETGNTSGALRHFEAGARHGYGAAIMGLGDTYRQMGNRTSAVAAYRRYLERLPNGPESRRARNQIDALGGGDAPDPTPDPTPTPDPDPSPTPDPDPTPAPAPATAPDELPAPRGATEADLPAPDQPAVGSE